MKKVLSLVFAAVIISTSAGCSFLRTTNTKVTGTIAESSSENEPSQAQTTVPETTSATGVRPGYYIENSKLRFSFLKATMYDKLSHSEYYDDEPGAGKKFLVLFFDVQNISDSKQYVNSFYFKASEDDYEIQESYSMAEPDGYKMLSGELNPGKKMKGCLVYEVNPGWKKFEVSYEELYDHDSLDFELTPGDLTQ